MDQKETEFERAGDAAEQGIVREFWDFLVNNKKWWLLPIAILLLLFGVLMLVGGSPAGPFIYTLF